MSGTITEREALGRFAFDMSPSPHAPVATIDFNRFPQISTPLLPKQVRSYWFAVIAQSQSSLQDRDVPGSKDMFKRSLCSI